MKSDELTVFKYNIDLWIKDINSKISDFGGFPEQLQENIYNTEHNYELINEVKSEFEDLKKQIQTMKMTQLLMIKKLFSEDFENAAKDKDFMAKISKMQFEERQEKVS